jgi:hypothetical protein
MRSGKLLGSGRRLTALGGLREDIRRCEGVGPVAGAEGVGLDLAQLGIPRAVLALQVEVFANCVVENAHRGRDGWFKSKSAANPVSYPDPCLILHRGDQAAIAQRALALRLRSFGALATWSLPERFTVSSAWSAASITSSTVSAESGTVAAPMLTVT